MRYTLLQAPMQEDDYSSQIVIVDASDSIGRSKIAKLTLENYVQVGFIESDLRVQQLKSGFECLCRDEVNRARKVMMDASTMLNGFY